MWPEGSLYWRELVPLVLFGAVQAIFKVISVIYQDQSLYWPLCPVQAEIFNDIKLVLCTACPPKGGWRAVQAHRPPPPASLGPEAGSPPSARVSPGQPHQPGPAQVRPITPGQPGSPPSLRVSPGQPHQPGPPIYAGPATKPLACPHQPVIPASGPESNTACQWPGEALP